MAVCNPFVHIDPELLFEDSSNSESAAASFLTVESLTKPNASARFTKSLLLTATESVKTTLAVFVKKGDVSNESYPYLYSKVQNIPLSSEELAEFMLEYNYSDQDVIQTLQYVNDFANSIQETSKVAITPTNNPNITTSDIAGNTIAGAGVDLQNEGELALSVLIPSEKVSRLFEDMDNFYSNSIADAISGGLCSAIGDPLSKISSAINKLDSVVKQVTGTLDAIASFDPSSLVKGLMDEVSSQFNAIMSSIKGLVNKVIGDALSKLNNLVDKFKSLPGQMGAKFQQMARKVSDRFSDLNVGNFMNSLDSIGTSMINQFKNINLESMALMAFRFCQMSNPIAGFFMGPLTGLQKMFENTLASVELHKYASAQQVERIKAIGIPMSDFANRANAAAVHQQKVLDSPKITFPMEQVPQKQIPLNEAIPRAPAAEVSFQITEEEKKWLAEYNTDSATSDPDVRCGAGVHSMAKNAHKKYKAGKGNSSWFVGSENVYNEAEKYDDGLGRILANRPDYFIALRRFAKKYGKTVTINSAYRSPFYNSTLDTSTASKRYGSFHTKSQAIDVSISEHSTSTAKQLAKWCGKYGFNCVGIYKTFLHFDDRQNGPYTYSDRNSEFFKAFVQGHAERGSDITPPEEETANTASANTGAEGIDAFGGEGATVIPGVGIDETSGANSESATSGTDSEKTAAAAKTAPSVEELEKAEAKRLRDANIANTKREDALKAEMMAQWEKEQAQQARREAAEDAYDADPRNNPNPDFMDF